MPFCITVFSRFWLSSTSTHYLQAAGGCLPHFKVFVSPASTPAHTHTSKHHFPWHTQATACPCPFVTQPLAPPHSVPLACHFTTTSLLCGCVCVCVLIYMSMCALKCVYWSVCVCEHTSPSPIWNMAVSAQSVYLDSSLQQKTLVAADGRSTTTNSSETRRSNRSQVKWRRHALNDICGLHSCTVDTLLMEGGCCIKP